jgi:hypothetical protein
MKIPLQEALDLIEASDVVKLLDGSSFILPHITTEGTNGDPDNEVMYVTWDDDDGDFSFRVCEGENIEVERDGHKLTIIDDEGDSFELHLFREVPILP